MNKNHQNHLVVVLGMHRCGTSAVARGLKVIGVELGDKLIPAGYDNPKGFWEDADVLSLNIDILHAIGRDWHHLAAVTPSDIEFLRDKGFFLRAAELLRKKFRDTHIFAFKDPRTVKLLSFWKEVFSNCKFKVSYVLVVRHPLSVVKSLAKRNTFEAEISYLLWLGHVIASLEETVGSTRILVDYDHLMKSPDSELERIAECLCLEIIPSELELYKTDFLNQELRHTVYNLDNLLLDDACPSIVREIYAALLNVASGQTDIDSIELQNDVTRWLDEFNRLKYLLILIDRLLIRRTNDEQLLAERGKQIARHDRQIAELNDALARRSNELISLKSLVKRVGLLVLGQPARKLLRALTHPLRAYRIFQEVRFIRNSGLFDKNYYLVANEDVCVHCWDPIQHYCEFGWREGRNPSPQFDTRYYLDSNPDVAAAAINPYEHYIRHGKAEGRSARAPI